MDSEDGSDDRGAPGIPPNLPDATSRSDDPPLTCA